MTSTEGRTVNMACIDIFQDIPKRKKISCLVGAHKLTQLGRARICRYCDYKQFYDGHVWRRYQGPTTITIEGRELSFNIDEYLEGYICLAQSKLIKLANETTERRILDADKDMFLSSGVAHRW